MHKKKIQRLRRVQKTSHRIQRRGEIRLCVYKTPRHVYAQIISPDGGETLVSASSVDKALRGEITYGGNIKAAEVVGKAIAERAKQVGIQKVAFDRSGFHYHGRLKALAEAARAAGMKF